MTLIELLTAIGDDNLTFQNLDMAGDGLNWDGKTNRTTVTFQTECGIDMKTPTHGRLQKLGLVVWLDRDLVDGIRAGLEAKEKGMVQ